MNELLAQGLELMGFGLAGVFATLLFFILAIIILVRVFPEKSDNDK